MKSQALLFCICLEASIAAGADEHVSAWAVAAALPPWEMGILRSVGREYGLSPDELKLLMAIRRIENGRPGLEMGVASNYPRHSARRYPHDAVRSLRVQAQWAAGTIKRRYTGNLAAFARVYCPPKPEHWAHMVGYWLTRE